MARINRYDTPAESNYFNTFVPLPLDQITALGMKRQEDLERRQDVASKYIDEASMIDYIPGSKDEERVKNEFLPEIQRLAEEAMSVDLSNPVEWAKYSTRLKRLSLSDDIKRIEQSAAGYKQALAIAKEQRMKGVYNPLLDDTSKMARGWNSQSGIFDYTPESQIDKAKLFEPYYSDLANQGRFGTMNGIQGQWVGVSRDRVANVAAQSAQELAGTPGGQQIARLARMTNPGLYEGMDDYDILRMQMTDYGMQKHGETFHAFPEGLQQGAGGSSDAGKPWTTNPQAIPGGEVEADIMGIKDVLEYNFASPTSEKDQWSHNPYSWSGTASRLTDLRNAMNSEEYQNMLEKRSNAISKIIQKYPHMAYSADGSKRLSDNEILDNYRSAMTTRMDSATFVPNDLDVLEYTQKIIDKTFNNSRIVIQGIKESFSPQELADELGFEDVKELRENLEILAPSFNTAGGISASVISKKSKGKVAKALADGGNELIITGNLKVDNAMKPLNQIRQMVDRGDTGRVPITKSGKYVNIDYDFTYINGEPMFIPIYTMEQKVGENQFETLTIKDKTGNTIPARTTLQELYDFSLTSIYGPKKTFDPNKTTPSRGLTYYSD